MVTSRMHMTIGMVRRKRNVPIVNYIQKNVCSTMSVNIKKYKERKFMVKV